MLCISVLFKVRMVCRKLRSWLNRCKVYGLIKEATNQSKCWFFNKSQKSKDSGGKQQVTTKRPSLELWAHSYGHLLIIGEILFPIYLNFSATLSL